MNDDTPNQASFSFNRHDFRMNSSMHRKMFKEARRFSIQNLYIYLLPLQASEVQSYLSINITKKAVAKSVDRHKLKRKFIEYFRLNRAWIGKYHLFVRFSAKTANDFDFTKFEKGFIDKFDRDYSKLG